MFNKKAVSLLIYKVGAEKAGAAIFLVGVAGIIIYVKVARKPKSKKTKVPTDRDKIWQKYGEKCKKHIQDKNYGYYRNCRYDMAKFVKEEGKYINAVSLFTEVCFWDLTECGNNFDYKLFVEITLPTLFPYKSSIMTLAPAVIREIEDCRKKLEFTDEQLRAEMLRILQKLTAPVQFFTPVEIIDIFFWERDGNEDMLEKVYTAAKKRFNPSSPNVASMY